MDNVITIIGAAVQDLFVGPVSKDLFSKGSVPAKNMGFSCGGDALNEAVFLSRLGKKTELVTLLGEDEPSEMIFKCLKDNYISTDKVTVSKDIVTSTNIVLVDEDGERYFITNPESSLRKLSKEHILPYIDRIGDIVSFASIFVSSSLSILDMTEIFKAIKEKTGRILVADMTTAKNGETIEDLEPLLGYIDYIIPNEKEAALLTGESDPLKSALSFIEHGAKCVVIKCGKDGCVYADGENCANIPCYPAKAIDTTGAGDSFVSGFIYGLSEGMSIAACCRYGCAVASTVVEKMGSQSGITNIEEVNKRFTAIKNNTLERLV